jgi:NTP pyrophosphatase (non-canonical NTP hydrolase)
MEDLSFARLREANVERCHEVYHPVNEWSESDWATAIAGECGEVCHAIKIRRRGEDLSAVTVGAELADLVIYADLLAERLGIDLGDAIRRKFNETSRKVKSKVQL